MDNGVSPGEVGGVLAGAIAILAALGKGAQWLFNWKGAREDHERQRLRLWEESLDRRERERREEAERQERIYREQTDGRMAAMESKIGVLSGALFEAIGELQRLDPASGVLVCARHVLRELYPVDPEVPDAIRTLVRRIDGDIS